MADEPSIVILGRTRGRPKAATPLETSVTTWLPTDLADALYKLARRREAKVSAVVRDILTTQLQSRSQ